MTKQLTFHDYLELINYSYNSEEEKIKKQLATLSSDIAEYEKKTSEINSLVEIQKKNIITLRNSKKENLLHIDKFQKENKELIKKLSGLKIRTKELEDKKHNIESLINEHEKHVNLIAHLKKDSNKKNSKVSNRNTQFNSLITDVESLKDDSKFHENFSKSYSNSALEITQEELKKLKRKNANLQRKITIRKKKSLSDNPSISESIAQMKNVDAKKIKDVSEFNFRKRNSLVFKVIALIICLVVGLSLEFEISELLGMLFVAIFIIFPIADAIFKND